MREVRCLYIGGVCVQRRWVLLEGCTCYTHKNGFPEEKHKKIILIVISGGCFSFAENFNR